MKKAAVGIGKIVIWLVRVFIALILFLAFIFAIRDSLAVSAVLFFLSAISMLPRSANYLSAKLKLSKYLLVGASFLFFIAGTAAPIVFPAPEKKEIVLSEEEKAAQEIKRQEEEKKRQAKEKARELRMKRRDAEIQGKRQLKSILKDGDSAKFRNDFASVFLAYCGEVNAKNAFGAYTGFQRFIIFEGQALFEDAKNTSEFTTLWKTVCLR